MLNALHYNLIGQFTAHRSTHDIGKYFFLICELVKLILIKHYLLALVLHCTFKEKITLLMVTWHGHTSSAFMLCDEYSHSIVNRLTLSTVKIKGQSKR